MAAKDVPDWWWDFWAVAGEGERFRTFVLATLAFGAFVIAITLSRRRFSLLPMKHVLLGEKKRVKRELELNPNPSLPTRKVARGELDSDAELVEALIVLAQFRVEAEEARLTKDANLAPMATEYAARLPASHKWLANGLLKTDSEPADRRAWLSLAIRTAAELGVAEDRQRLTTYRKAYWLAILLAGFVVAMVTVLGNPGFAVWGIAGASISRLLLVLRAENNTDRRIGWPILFLTPVVGALSGMSSVLAVDALHAWGALGDIFTRVDWADSTMHVEAAFVAFLAGFSERLLDKLANLGLGKFASGVDAEGAAVPNPSSAPAPLPSGRKSAEESAAVVKATLDFGGIYHLPACGELYERTEGARSATFCDEATAREAGFTHGSHDPPLRSGDRVQTSTGG